MNKILIINSSTNNEENSRSKQLVDYFKNMWHKKFPNDTFTYREIVSPALPHIDQTTVSGFYTPEAEHDETLKDAVKLSDELIDELVAADIVVIGSPMHNFTIPSTLKAYFDLVARVNKTFEFTENGPKGKIPNKKVFVITTQGGFYIGHPDDLHTPYFTTIFKFLGIEDLTFFQAEGLDTSPEALEAGMKKAKQAITETIEAC